MIRPDRPQYSKAWAALEAAHKACFDHPDRDVLGMSHGPFSGVNVALEIVLVLEERCMELQAALRALKQPSTGRR